MGICPEFNGLPPKGEQGPGWLVFQRGKPLVVGDAQQRRAQCR